MRQGLPEGSDENRKVDTPKASLMDLTSKEEVKKAKDMRKGNPATYGCGGHKHRIGRYKSTKLMRRGVVTASSAFPVIM